MSEIPAVKVFLDHVRKLAWARRKGGKAAAAASFVALFYVTLLLRQARRPVITCRRTSHNMRLLKAMADVVDRPYHPSWLTPNAHVNCALGFFKRGPRQPKTRELVHTWDGGTFALDWRNRGASEPDLGPEAPTLLIIHGLNGHTDEACVLYQMENAWAKGWRAVAMNHRGCGGTPLTSGWSYNAAFTGDVRLAVCHVRQRYPESPIYAVGFSLGGNLLVKYLGEEGRIGNRPLAGAVSISNPWNLRHNTLGGPGRAKGIRSAVLAKFYGFALTIGIKLAAMQHKDSEALKGRKEVDVAGGLRAGSLNDWDKAVLLPMWGYKTVEEYQEHAASDQDLADVRCPLLCINAADDPISQAPFFPLDQARCNPCVIFVATHAGGHIGFGEGFNPFGRQSWADRLTSLYLKALADERDRLEKSPAIPSSSRGFGRSPEASSAARL